jgi:hypothetical protein
MKQDKEDSVKDAEQEAEKLYPDWPQGTAFVCGRSAERNAYVEGRKVSVTQLAAQSEQIRQLQEEVKKEKMQKDFWVSEFDRVRQLAKERSEKISELESLLSSEKEKHGQTWDAAVEWCFYKGSHNEKYTADKSTYLSSLTQTDVKTEK